MSEDMRRIAAKLEALKAADHKCLLFGVGTHRYRLGPPLLLNELKTIEEKYGIGLPEDYSAFLREIGNGGAGPGYGLQRFGFVESASEIPTAEPRGPYRVVKKTRNCTESRQDLFDASGRKVDPFDVAFFDLMKVLAPDGGDGPLVPSQPFPLSEPLREESEKWENLNPAAGSLLLSDYGCGMSAHLVLNGPFRGEVWLYDPNARWFVPFNVTASLHYPDLESVKDEDARTTFKFGSWYEHWIDNALAQVPQEYED